MTRACVVVGTHAGSAQVKPFATARVVCEDQATAEAWIQHALKNPELAKIRDYAVHTVPVLTAEDVAALAASVQAETACEAPLSEPSK